MRDHEPGRDYPEPPEGPEHEGRVRSTSLASLAVVGLVGVVLGWLTRPVSVRLTGTAPTVSWLPGLALFFVALAVGWVAWSTHRLLHRRGGMLAPHHAVNRLVLAKACALAGALFAGGYVGYAVSWLGRFEGALARERVLHSGAAAVAGILLVVGSLLLERACRVRKDGR